MIASERREGCQREHNEDEQHQRIFIKISRKTTRDDLESEFSVSVEQKNGKSHWEGPKLVLI